MTPFITAAWTLIAGAMVLFLPGLAWQAFFWDPEQDTFERLAEVLGLSAALIAVIALLAYLLGLRLTSTPVIIVYGLLAIPAAWALRRWWRERTWGQGDVDQPGGEITNLYVQPGKDEQTSYQGQGKLVYLTLSLVFLVVLVWRFYQKEPVIYVEKYYPDLCAVLQSCDCVVSWKTQASLKVKTLLFVERAAVTDMHRSLMFDEYGYEIVSN